MRQGNSKQRMRGRGGNGGAPGRKGPNPLSRSYESTGPDVKIRGTALHIAEKYVSLARDAHSSGDPVLSENYLQHAEHYYRIIAAAQAQMPQPVSIVRSDMQSEDEEDDYETYQEPRFEQRGGPEPRFEPRGESRSVEGRGFEPREPRDLREPREPRAGEDSFVPLDAPQPFVDDPSGDRTERMRDDRRPLGDRRGRGFRSGPRSDTARAEGGPRSEGPVRSEGRPPRERHPRDEAREPVRTIAADATPDESDLEQLPAFLMAPMPRPTAAPTPAPAVPAEEAAAGEGEAAAPRRRTRGGRGRGRRVEAEGDEAPAETPVTVED
jgi:hypothetical protein